MIEIPDEIHDDVMNNFMRDGIMLVDIKTHESHYKLPVKVYSHHLLEKRVEELERQVASLGSRITTHDTRTTTRP